MIRHSVMFMRKHKYIILIPLLTLVFCWTLMTDATESEPGTLQYLELFSQTFELVQSRYLEETDPVILAEGAVEGMLLALNPYSALLPVSGSSGLIPPFGPLDSGMVIGFKDPMIQVIDVIPGSPAESSGILPGDMIIRIGELVTPYLTIDRASRMLTGQKGESVELFKQNHLTGDLDELELTFTETVNAPAAGLHVTFDESVRIIRFAGALTEETVDKLYAELILSSEPMPTILDLRHLNRGDEYNGIMLADLFVAGDLTMLHTCSDDSRLLARITSSGDRALTGFPLAVIIDNTSAGPAETCAAALQNTQRAIITGDTSFGKAVYYETRPLNDMYQIRMVTGLYCYPDGRLIYRNGVKPDIPVQLPAQENIDPYLQTARIQVFDTVSASPVSGEQ